MTASQPGEVSPVFRNSDKILRNVPRGDGTFITYQSHHLINTETHNGSELLKFLQSAVDGAGNKVFDYDHTDFETNGIALPTDSDEAARRGLAQHRGSHKKLNEFTKRLFSDSGSGLDIQFRERTRQLQKADLSLSLKDAQIKAARSLEGDVYGITNHLREGFSQKFNDAGELIGDVEFPLNKNDKSLNGGGKDAIDAHYDQTRFTKPDLATIRNSDAYKRGARGLLLGDKFFGADSAKTPQERSAAIAKLDAEYEKVVEVIKGNNPDITPEQLRTEIRKLTIGGELSGVKSGIDFSAFKDVVFSRRFAAAALTNLGIAGDALGLYIAHAQAQEQIAEGNTAGAILTYTKFIAEFGAGVLVTALAIAVVGPTTLLGVVGVSLLAGTAGAILGEAAVDRAFNAFKNALSEDHAVPLRATAPYTIGVNTRLDIGTPGELRVTDTELGLIGKVKTLPNGDTEFSRFSTGIGGESKPVERRIVGSDARFRSFVTQTTDNGKEVTLTVDFAENGQDFVATMISEDGTINKRWTTTTVGDSENSQKIRNFFSEQTIIDPAGGGFVDDPEINLIQIDENNQRIIQNAGQIGAALGSSIGNAIAGNNVFARIASSSVIGTIGLNLGEIVGRTITGSNLDVAIDTSLGNFGSELAASVRGAGAGAIGSFLTAELAQLVGIGNDFGGELLQVVVNSQIVTPLADAVIGNLVGGVETALGFTAGSLGGGATNAASLGNVVGSFIGSKLADEVISAKTKSGAIGGSIGSAVGSVIGSFIPVPILGSALGAFVGKVLGTVIGDFVGKKKKPRSDAFTAFRGDPFDGEFVITHTNTKDGGSLELSRGMANALNGTLNAYLRLIGGEYLSPNGGAFVSQQKGLMIVRTPGGVQREAHLDATKRAPEIVVEQGTLDFLRLLKIAGGNLYVKRALAQSKATTVQGLAGDVTIAADYARYQENKALIDGLILAAPKSAFAAGWIITLLQAEELGITELQESDFHGGLKGFLASFQSDRTAQTRAHDEIDVSLDGTTLVVVQTSGDATVRRIELGDFAKKVGYALVAATADGAAVTGTAGNDLWFAADGVASTFTDGAGRDDILIGSAGADTISAGAGRDWVDGGGGNDTLNGGAGNDVLIGGDGADVVHGDAGDDWISGGAGDDKLFGDAGKDFLRGGVGADTLDGGAGIDTASFGDLGTGVTVDLVAGTAVRTVTADNPATTGVDETVTETDTLTGIESLIGTKFGDVLSGDASDNLFVGLGGDDTIDGRDGADAVDYSGSKQAITADLGAGTIKRTVTPDDPATTAVDETAIETDTLINIEAVIGSKLDDTLTGSVGADTLSGNDGNDTLLGAAGDDTLDGGAGDDVLDGGAGADTLKGGNGADTAIYDTSLAGVTVDLAAKTGLGGDAQGDKLSGIENLRGSAHGDTLKGDGNANVLDGGAGSDTLEGRAGDDTYLFARGSGLDTVTDTGGADTIRFGAGISLAGIVTRIVGINLEIGVREAANPAKTFDQLDDRVTLTGWKVASSKIEKLSFADGGVIDISQVTALVEGTTAADGALAAAADTPSWLNGLAGNDTITGSSKADIIVGGAGNDVLGGALAGDQYAYWAGDGDDIVSDTGGLDTLAFGAGITRDLIKLRRGALAVTTDPASFADAAAGADLRIEVLDATDKTKVTGSITIRGHLTLDTMIERFRLADGTEISLSDLLGELTATSFGDILNGSDGNDVISGLAGADVIDGGGGFDTADYSASSLGVTVNLSTGKGTGGDAEGDKLSNVEGVKGSIHNDTLIGDAGANVLEGGLGADTLKGGGGSDTAAYTGSSASVTVDLAANTANGGDAVGDTYDSIENLRGSTHDDTLRGGDGANILDGGAGSDTLEGRAGDDIYLFVRGSGVDTLVDTGGADTLQLGAGIELADIVTRIVGTGLQIGLKEAANPTKTFDELVDQVTLTGWTVATSKIETLSFADGGVIDLTAVTALVNGTDAADGALATAADTPSWLNGLGGNDTVTGSSVGDVLAGGAGADVLNGGLGGDQYVYWKGDSDDIISDTGGLDTLVFGGGITRKRLNLRRGTLTPASGATPASFADSATGADLRIETLNGTVQAVATGSVTIRNYLSLDNMIEQFRFADGRAVSLTSLVGDLVATSFDDVLRGSDGDDVIAGLAGADSIDGAGGADTADYSASDAGVTVDLSAGTGIGGHAQGDALSNFESIIGSTHDDVLTGDGGSNTLYGGAGTDSLFGKAGNDLYRFGRGDGQDRIVDEDRFDETRTRREAYTATRPKLSNGEQVQVCNGEGGGCVGATETYTAYRTVEYTANVHNDGGADTLVFGAGIAATDLVARIVGQDLVIGIKDPAKPTAAFADLADKVTLAIWLETKDRIETFQFADGSKIGVLQIVGLLGTEEVDTITWTQTALVVDGGAGNDVITSGDFDDQLTGGSGDDTLTGAAGADTLVGGGGADTLNGGGGGDTLNGGEGADTLNGDGGADKLIGGDDNDTLNGGADGDDLDGGTGNDILIGGGGDDVYRFGVGSGVDTVRHTAGAGRVIFAASVDLANVVFKSAGDDLIVFVSENDSLTIEGWFADPAKRPTFELSNGAAVPVRVSVVGTNNAETLTGTVDDDVISGLGGDDTLSGLAGSDTLNGGSGTDLLQGGSGDDLYRFGRGDGIDRVVDEDRYDETRTRKESYRASRRVRITSGERSGQYRTEYYTATRDVDYTANVHNDGGADTLVFGAGIAATDLIVRIVGQDLVVGVKDPANPTAAFADLADKVTLANWLEPKDRIETFQFADGSAIGVAALQAFTSGTDAADSPAAAAVPSWISGLAGNDTLNGSAGGDVLLGGSGDDTLNGNAGNDWLTGGSGNDTLTGGAGNDVLVGGAGSDTYKFGAGDGADTIDNNDSSAGSTDTLEFGGVIDKNDLWFAQVDNDLVVSLLGSQDKVTVDNWYDSADNQLDQFVDSGGTTLDAASVNQLVAAMATFQPNDGTDATGVLPDQLPTDVQVAVNGAWQTPAS